jgi:hypothetical protein
MHSLSVHNKDLRERVNNAGREPASGTGLTGTWETTRRLQLQLLWAWHGCISDELAEESLNWRDKYKSPRYSGRNGI